MSIKIFKLSIILLVISSCGWSDKQVQNSIGNASKQSIYSFSMISITGEKVSLSAYSGKVLLLVNVASKCGLTPQYKELQALFEKYREQGLMILGFPANNFLGQEPGTNEEIKTFCELNFGVSFPLFSKISVKGDDIHPLYKFLTSKKENGVFDAPVKWNFQKFLIDRQGRLVASFGPAVKVTDQEILEKIKILLEKK